MARFRSSRFCWFHSENCMYGLLKPLCRKKSASACIRSLASMPKSSPVYFENLTHFIAVIRLIKLPPLARPRALFRLRRRPFPFLGRKAALFRAADLALCIEPLEDELPGGPA